VCGESVGEIKEHPKYKGYWVADWGALFSIQSGKRKEQTQFNHKGYRRVSIQLAKNKQRYFPIHALVLETFRSPRPKPNSQTRHKDHKKDHNCVHNLSWGTPRENADDSHRGGRYAIGENVHGAKLGSEEVIEILATPRHITLVELARKYGVCKSTIWAVRSRRNWRHIPRPELREVEE